MESARKEEGEMSQQDYLERARWFQCLSHPLRLRILEELCDGEKCVCELQQVLHKPQPYISQQLRMLRMAGLVACRKRGQFAFYTLADPRVEETLKMLRSQQP